ncbi:MAG: hypothetical protein ACRD2H_01490 [Terriglobales bacterium]
MIRKSGLIVTLLCALGLMLPLGAQNVSTATFFGGAILGDPSGFQGGAGLGFGITHNVSFEPSFAIGRTGGVNVFTLDGVFDYNFHLQHGQPIPYILGGVGLAQYANSTHGSPIVGGGVRFPISDGWQIRPEIRWGTHGLSRFTIGLTKTF